MLTTAQSPVDVEGLDSAYLDCIVDNVAAVLRHHGVRDVRTPFACQWHFGFDETADPPLPDLERIPFEDVVARLTGFELVCLDARGESADPVEACVAALGEGVPALVVGDAFLMPWQPYYDHEHMLHSFVVEALDEPRGRVGIADAYENTTEWGDARPIHAEIGADDLREIAASSPRWKDGRVFVLRRTREPHEPDVRELVRANAAAMSDAGALSALARFRAFYAARAAEPDSAKRFTLACWLAARARSLHALWLHDVEAQLPPDAHGTAAAFAELAAVWRRVAELAYVAERRARAGRGSPTTAFALLEREIEPRERALAESLRSALASS